MELPVATIIGVLSTEGTFGSLWPRGSPEQKLDIIQLAKAASRCQCYLRDEDYRPGIWVATDDWPEILCGDKDGPYHIRGDEYGHEYDLDEEDFNQVTYISIAETGDIGPNTKFMYDGKCVYNPKET